LEKFWNWDDWYVEGEPGPGWNGLPTSRFEGSNGV
jgi:hypothetical protein